MGDKPTIFEVFAAVKREVRPVGKDSRNTQQNFNFRGVDAVVNSAAPALDKHGVITAPHLDKVTYGTVEVGQKRTPMAHVQVEVTYTFYGPGGDSFSVTVPGEAMDSGDKGTAKAMSVAYRIALLQALNLPTDERDPDADTYDRSPGGKRQGGTAADDTTGTDLRGWEMRVSAATTVAAANAVGSDLRRMYDEGRLAAADASQVKAMLDARVTEIKAASRQQTQGGGPNRQGSSPVSRMSEPEPAKDTSDDVEGEFVRRFLERVVDADETGIRSMRVELAKAVSMQKIAPKTGNELGQALTEHLNSLRDAA